MSYSDKLRHPKWQRKRLEILNRDNFRCIFCGADDKNLQVHHILYLKRDPWDYENYLYQTLCDECHAERQALTDKIVTAVRIAIAKVGAPKLLSVSQKICDEAMLEIEVDA